MKKFLTLLLCLLVLLTSCSQKKNDENKGNLSFTAGTYSATAKGRNGSLKVEVTVTDSAIKEVKVVEHTETEDIAKPAIESIPKAIVDKQSLAIDAVSGATITSDAILLAAETALKEAGGDIEALKGGSSTTRENVEVTYTPGTYSGVSNGYHGEVKLDVTFSEKAITDIVVVESRETLHVGDIAYPILFEDIKAANGTGVDVVSGATFTSIAVKNAVNAAAEAAKASDLAGFKQNTIKHEPKEAIKGTWDVVVIGAGGAGMAAAVQAAQDGHTVLIIEENAEIGGNTLVSGGQFQTVQYYLVWDPANPDATTGEYNGQTYNKVKSDQGRIHTLEIIANWDEKEFDGKIDDTVSFVIGDIEQLSKRGVHASYLQTLKDLKAEIKAYLDWAKPQLEAGKKENELTVFSTINLHIFQSYYGGLRPNQEHTEWIYGDYNLVSQFINGGQQLKPWLEAMGVQFMQDKQATLIGALWQRENILTGAIVNGQEVKGNWGAYFEAPRATLLSLNSANEIMLRTKATELIYENDRVVGVKAIQYDGTEVEALATKGVVIATGGYAANTKMVVDTNDYWTEENINENIKTTNRSSLVGGGIEMAQKVGANTTGLEFTQLMPISWIQDGNLAFGGGEDVIYLNPTTGNRYVDESSERDVLSAAALANGIEVDGTKGVFVEVGHVDSPIPGPYPYKNEDVKWRQYVRDLDGAAEVFKELGINISKEQLEAQIRAYDQYVMGQTTSLDIPKSGYRNLIGSAEKDEAGNWLPETYTIGQLRIRFMAPSTHHTMGGLAVDTDRRVLDNNGQPIKGLYAAGEVTGGIHGGNRLGGNAIVEILVSGRTAAQAISADNK